MCNIFADVWLLVLGTNRKVYYCGESCGVHISFQHGKHSIAKESVAFLPFFKKTKKTKKICRK